MNIFRFQQDAVVPGFSQLFFLFLSVDFFADCFLWSVLCARTTTKAHVDSSKCTFTTWNTYKGTRREKKDSLRVEIEKCSAFCLNSYRWCVLYQLLHHPNQMNPGAHTHTHRSPINLFHFDFNRFMGKSFTLPMFKFSWRCALRFWHTHKHTHRIWRCMREKRVFPHARAHSFVCTLCQILLDICYMRI